MLKYLIIIIALFTTHVASSQKRGKSRTALQMEKLGFQNIADKDSTIAIRLMYARSDNFTGKVLYTDLHEAYLHPDAMESLLQAQKLLKKYRPGYRLVVYDASRPMHIQQIMWDAVKGTKESPYVSNPKNGGGMHNYGLAVDVSILNEKGDSIPMGTKVDYMGSIAHIDKETFLVQQRKITSQAKKNRELLRRVMTEAGFRPLRTEWWHFNRVTRSVAKKYYKPIP